MLKINLSWNREEPEDEGKPSANSSAGPERAASPASGAAPVSDTLFLTAPEPEAPSGDSAAPEKDAALPDKNRRPKDRQEKVPLSDRAEIPEEIRTAMRKAGPPPEEREESPAGPGKRIRVVALAAVLVLAAGYFAWTQRDSISGLIPSKPPVKAAALGKAAPSAKPAPAPETNPVPAPAASPGDSAVGPAPVSGSTAPAAPAALKNAETPSAPAGSDPVLSALYGISTATPPRVWLTSATARSDGTYELKGMSFSHAAMRSFAAALERRGTIASRDIPAETKSPDTIYSFHLSGKLNDLHTPEILDAIPAGRLYALGDSLRAMPKEADVLVVRLPKTGKAYAESELPFELEGPYSGVQKTLDRFLSNRGIIIDRIFIHPAASGKQFNRVRISFSLRTVSSI